MSERLPPEIRGLVWKEIRQLTPLLTILTVIGSAVVAVWLVLASLTQVPVVGGGYVPLVLPGLFAAGAAALLVGQEKEQRTLWWMAAIPVPPTRIILIKFVVAGVGLVLMWLVSWLLLWAAQTFGGRGAFAVPILESRAALVSLHLYSLYLLIAGFYTSWRIESAFASLIALLPVAAVPLAIAQVTLAGYAYGADIRVVDREVAMWWTTIVVAISTLVTALYAWRAATRTLSPAESDADEESRRWLFAWRPTTSTASVTTLQPFRSSLISLVWQSIHHRPITLLAMAGSLWLATIVVALAYAETSIVRDHPGIVAFAALVTFITVSWLGVAVFTGDTRMDRVRFLAERGVSPSKIWLGQQLVGINILAVALLVYASVILLVPRTSESTGLPMPSVATLCIVAWIIYAISQWTSQAIRIVAASAFVAPLLSAAALYWLSVSAMEFETSLGSILLCGTLPVLASWFAMPAYVDGRRGSRTWIGAAAVIALMVCLPVAPMVVEITRLPSIPPQDRQRMMIEAQQAWADMEPPRVIRPAEVSWSDNGFWPDIPVDKALAMIEQQDQLAENYLQFDPPNDSSTPATIDHYVLMQALGLASKALLAVESETDSAADRAFDNWVSMLTEAAKRLRGSRRWIDQQHCDLIDIWLTQVLADPSLQNALDRTTVKRAVDHLTDQSRRNQSRRRAVLASWYAASSPGVAMQREGVGMLHFNFFGGAKSDTFIAWARPKLIDAVVQASLDLIEAGTSGDDIEPAKRRLHTLLVGADVAFEDGPYGPQFHAGAHTPQRFTISEYWMTYPATLWYGPWERDAQNLATELNHQTEENGQQQSQTLRRPVIFNQSNASQDARTTNRVAITDLTRSRS